MIGEMEPWRIRKMNSEQVREGLQQVRAELERLREVEEAARAVLESEAGPPDAGCRCDYCTSRRELGRLLEHTWTHA